jgi:hypothetical protein
MMSGGVVVDVGAMVAVQKEKGVLIQENKKKPISSFPVGSMIRRSLATT